MSDFRVSRRRALVLGGGAAAAAAATGVSGVLGLGATRPPAERLAASTDVLQQRGRLPDTQIQRIVGVGGFLDDGVLGLNVGRHDIGRVVGPRGIIFTGAFGLRGVLSFQPLGGDLAFFSGTLPVRPEEVSSCIDAITAAGMILEALHQPLIQTSPQVAFVSWRGVGAPLDLASAVRRILNTTATPLPQHQPQGPQSPLDAEHLSEILHGGAQIGGEGVVMITVSRRTRIEIGRVHASPSSTTSTSIAFKPRASRGTLADVAANFALTGSEVPRVVKVMREQDWFVSGLTHHETEESPQLYFAQMLKTGPVYALAGEVRRALALTDSAS